MPFLGLTALELGLLGASLASTGASIGLGVAGNQQQQRAMGQQKKAQAEQVAEAGAAQRASQQREAMANRKSPDIGSILQNAASAASNSSSSTMLTGPTGANVGAGMLGSNSLLGG